MRTSVQHPPSGTRGRRGQTARLAVPVLALGLVAGCTADTPTAGDSATPSVTVGDASPTPATTTPAAPQSSAPASPPSQAQVVGTVVRFTSDDVHVDVTIGADTPAVRDFLSTLPLTLDLEELSGREKIAYLPRELEYAGSPGSDPEDGDLIYYTPWGNLGFYYDAAGIGYSDQTLHIGTYDATLDQLNSLEGPGVRVEIVP